MSVVIPVSGDPANPRPSGIMSYSLGLGEYLSRGGFDVEYLCLGQSRQRAHMKMTAVSENASGEVAFVRALRRHLRRHPLADDDLVAANTELYAWGFRGRLRSRPLVLVAHGPTYTTLRVSRPLAAAVFRSLIEPRATSLAHAIIAIDEESKVYFQRRYPEKTTHHIPLPIDVEHFRSVDRTSSREKWNLSNKHAFLYIGRLAPEKNLAFLLKVYDHLLEALPAAVLVVAGVGPLQHLFEAAAARLGSDRIRILGSVPRDDLPSLYSASDAVLLTSTIEQIPNAALESLACGTPVFATAAGELPKILDGDHLGGVCPAVAPDFARTVLQSIPENEVERAKYESIRRSVAARYSWERLGPRIVEVLHGTLPSSN